ncbi:MAG: CPBP family intramembrane metalloprotease [Oscillospiraceae bacterium]|nr:CPBP family intramembrane metalloprotease [Oscillospiraceae bacterium]
MTGSKKKYTVLGAYCLCFYAVWAVFELFVKESIGSQMIKTGLIKNLAWVLPAALLIHKYPGSVQIKLKEMFTTRVRWRKYLWLFGICAVFVLAGSVMQTGGVAVSEEFGMDSIIIVLFVGITEETVFRGWLLNATVNSAKPWPAIIINAVMFLIIHFPIWIADGIFAEAFTSLGFVTLMALSVMFSLTFLKSRNIFVPVTLHMFYDLLVFMLLG